MNAAAAVCAARAAALLASSRPGCCPCSGHLADGKLPVTQRALCADPRRRAAELLRQMLLTAGGALLRRDCKPVS